MIWTSRFGAALVALMVLWGCSDEPVLARPPRLAVHEVDGQRYYLYLPANFPSRGRVLAIVHGDRRTPRPYANAWVQVAKRERVALVAPLFDRAAFPDYRTLNLGGRRADLALEEILDDVARRTGADVGRFYLFGFSGGGQFAHRYALAHPERIARVVAGAPGWWTAPDPALAFPDGVGRPPDDLTLDVDAFAALSLAVVVGETDRHRVELATAWQQAMRQRGADFELAVVPDVGHRGTHPAVTARAAEFLFAP